MKTCTTLLLILITSFLSANAQQIFELRSASLSIENMNKLSGLIREYEVISINPETIATHCKDGECTLTLITPGREWTITLENNRLLSPNYQMAINGKINAVQSPTVKTYKGFIGDNLDNYVRLTIGNDFLDGYLKIDSTLLFIKPVKHILPDYPYSDRFVLFNSSDIIYDPSIPECGVLTEAKALSNQLETQTANQKQSTSTSCYLLEIATEADYEFYQSRGYSQTAANNSILSELNQVEGLYQSTFNIQFIITFQNVWTTSSDPYTIVGSFSTANALLNEVINYWQANFSTVPRDFVHFFSGKEHNIRGTAANNLVGNICEVSGGTYAMTATNLAGSSIPNIANSTAHEMAHVFDINYHTGIGCSTLMCVVIGPVDNRNFQFSSGVINDMN